MKRALGIYDPVLFGLSLLATALGMLFVFDAGYPRSLALGRGIVPSEFRSQLIFLGPALIGAALTARVRPERWKRASGVIFILTLFLLLATDVVGISMNGARRWLGYGQFAVQPAEFAKVASILFLAGVFASRKAWPKKMPAMSKAQWMDTVPRAKLIRALPAFAVLLAVGLIEKEPDLGTAAVVAATAFAMFFPGGVTGKSLLASVVCAGLFAGLMVVKEPYRLDRIQNHVHRWEGGNADEIGFQTVQSEAAMASGGIFGVGLGNGRAKHILPATTTDFIMATVGEETGLVGSLLVLAVLGGIVWRLKFQAARATDRFAGLVLYGVAAWIGIQACVNVMMANGALPAIGIPLPFISSGGSSLFALWLALGLCQGMLAPRKTAATAESEGAVVSEGTSATDRHGWRNRRTRLSGA